MSSTLHAFRRAFLSFIPCCNIYCFHLLTFLRVQQRQVSFSSSAVWFSCSVWLWLSDMGKKCLTGSSDYIRLSLFAMPCECRSWRAVWRDGPMTSRPYSCWGTPWRAWSVQMTSQSYRNASSFYSASGRRSATRYIHTVNLTLHTVLTPAEDRQF